jgi:hypothetical protein
LRRNRAQGEGSQAGDEPVGGIIGFLIHNLGVDEVDNPSISDSFKQLTPVKHARGFSLTVGSGLKEGNLFIWSQESWVHKRKYRGRSHKVVHAFSSGWPFSGRYFSNVGASPRHG